MVFDLNSSTEITENLRADIKFMARYACSITERYRTGSRAEFESAMRDIICAAMINIGHEQAADNMLLACRSPSMKHKSNGL